MAKHHIEATVNGDAVEFLCETEETLLDVLRDTLDLTGAKEGCANGNCGACTVLMDGRPVDSCLVLAVETEGRKLETIEGVAGVDCLDPIQQAFLENAALQCGICTPGFIMSCKSLLAENPNPAERHPVLPGGQPLPVHRVRQDRAGRTRRGKETMRTGSSSAVTQLPGEPGA